MRFAKILLCLLTAIPFITSAQENNPKDYHLEYFQRFSTTIFLVKRDTSLRGVGGYFIKTLTYNANRERVYSYYNLDSLLFYDTATSFGPGPTAPEEIHISFTDELNGFLYGYGTIYTYYPFIYRTADGGKTWTRIELNTGQLYKNSFYMFDAQHGIAISNSGHGNTYDYFITSDGGVTWQKQSITANADDPKKPVNLVEPWPVYRPDGKVTIVFGGYHVFQSTDHGNNFKLLK
jgi:hypothetical protein